MQQTRIFNSYNILIIIIIIIIIWYCRVLPKTLQTFHCYFSRTSAGLPDLVMTVCWATVSTARTVYHSEMCEAHCCLLWSIRHRLNDTDGPSVCPVSLHYHKPALEASIYELQIHSQYTFQLHLKTQSVPRSKHTPSQLYKPVS
jgi:hypothetical protein